MTRFLGTENENCVTKKDQDTKRHDTWMIPSTGHKTLLLEIEIKVRFLSLQSRVRTLLVERKGKADHDGGGRIPKEKTEVVNNEKPYFSTKHSVYPETCLQKLPLKW